MIALHFKITSFFLSIIILYFDITQKIQILYIKYNSVFTFGKGSFYYMDWTFISNNNNNDMNTHIAPFKKVTKGQCKFN